MKKKLLSIFLTLAMVMTMVPAATVNTYADLIPENDYLTFTAVGDDMTISFEHWKDMDLEFSLRGGEWKPMFSNGSILLKNGESVSFKGNDKVHEGSSFLQFKMSGEGKIAASGNVMSLLGEDDDSCTEYGFYRLFEDCDKMISAPKLPATTLAEGCYFNMFNGCTGLTQAPELPATTLAEGCYAEMFEGCTGLTQLPELPAKVLPVSCYSFMFYGCTQFAISENESEGSIPYAIPSDGTGEASKYSMMLMFSKESCDFDGTPEINKTYYVRLRDTKPAAAHDHQFSDTWSKNASVHWHASTCGCDDLTKDLAEHNYDAGTISKGIKTYTCKDCGYQKTETLKVSVPKTKIKSVKKAKKAFTVKWTKKNVTGYQIQYATNSKFTKGKKAVKITKASTLSRKIRRLKAKKKYYVRVRCYIYKYGKKYYSSWSTKKAISTK